MTAVRVDPRDIRDEEIFETVGILYEAAAASEGWPEALERLARLFNAVGVQLMNCDRAAGTVPFSTYGGEFDPQMQPLYQQQYSRLDPRLQLVARLPIGEVMACHHYFDEAFVRRDPFYNEFLIPHGLRYVLGGALAAEGERHVMLGILRSSAQGPFDHCETLLARLTPHLRRVAAMHARLQALEERVARRGEMIDHMPAAALVVDARRRVLDMNAAAQRAVARQELALSVRGGRLDVEDSAARAVFDTTLTAATRGRLGMAGCVAVRDADHHKRLVRILPLSSPGMAMVVLSEAETPRLPSGRSLSTAYGLTPAEAQLALKLAAGRRLSEIAAENHTRITTVRTQLRSVLSKTGTSRQADLVRLVLSVLP